MLVFGDLERRVSLTDELRALLQCGLELAHGPDELDRHGAATELLLRSGGLAQALLDEAFEARGADDWGPLEEACDRLLAEAASLFRSTWRREAPSRFSARRAAFRRAVAALGRMPPRRRLSIRVPEGFTFYSLYPENYLAAAARLRDSLPANPGPFAVIGIRSIGACLAHLVALELGGAPAFTVRPTGDPFDRRLQVGTRLQRLLLGNAHEGRRFAVVDEGPGLSGSSFAAVADWLLAREVGPERIHFLPSHAGAPGPRSGERHRALWSSVSRHVVELEELRTQATSCWPLERLRDARPLAVADWLELKFPEPAPRPPSNPAQERTKYLLDNGSALARFSGLGPLGKLKGEVARRLSDAGFVPRVLSCEQGWILQEWHEAPPLSALEPKLTNLDLAQVASYLAFRARELPCPPELEGSSIGRLREMIRRNTALAFGPRGAAALEDAESLRLSPSELRPVLVDGRLHPWEWLRDRQARLLKCDAFDHGLGHDLIGPQDIAWDIVGAWVEMELDESGEARLLHRLARDGIRRPPQVLEFFRLAYLAFQLGYYHLAAELNSGSEAGIHARLRARADRYSARIAARYLSLKPNPARRRTA